MFWFEAFVCALPEITAHVTKLLCFDSRYVGSIECRSRLYFESMVIALCNFHTIKAIRGSKYYRDSRRSLRYINGRNSPELSTTRCQISLFLSPSTWIYLQISLNCLIYIEIPLPPKYTRLYDVWILPWTTITYYLFTQFIQFTQYSHRIGNIACIL